MSSEHSSSTSTETFKANAQEDSCPNLLLTFISELLGYQSDNNNDETSRQNVLTICQIIMLNFRHIVKKNVCSGINRQNLLNGECPISVYLALKIHVSTRSKSLIDLLNSLGICISYKKVLLYEKNLAGMASHRFKVESVVAPISRHTSVPRHSLKNTVLDDLIHFFFKIFYLV